MTTLASAANCCNFARSRHATVERSCRRRLRRRTRRRRAEPGSRARPASAAARPSRFGVVAGAEIDVDATGSADGGAGVLIEHEPGESRARSRRGHVDEAERPGRKHGGIGRDRAPRASPAPRGCRPAARRARGRRRSAGSSGAGAAPRRDARAIHCRMPAIDAWSSVSSPRSTSTRPMLTYGWPFEAAKPIVRRLPSGKVSTPEPWICRKKRPTGILDPGQHRRPGEPHPRRSRRARSTARARRRTTRPDQLLAAGAGRAEVAERDRHEIRRPAEDRECESARRASRAPAAIGR